MPPFLTACGAALFCWCVVDAILTHNGIDLSLW
jgi:hypothetical protein